MRSTDRAGNVEDPSVSRNFTVDNSIRGRKVTSATRQKLKNRQVKVKVTVATGEKVEIRLTGLVTRGGGKIKQINRVAADGKKAELVAVLKTSRLNRKVAAQIRKGKTVRAELTVRVTDGVGNSRKAKKTIRLK